MALRGHWEAHMSGNMVFTVTPVTLAMEERGTLVQMQKENPDKEDSLLMRWPGPVYALSSTAGRKDSKVKASQWQWWQTSQGLALTVCPSWTLIISGMGWGRAGKLLEVLITRREPVLKRRADGVSTFKERKGLDRLYISGQQPGPPLETNPDLRTWRHGVSIMP